MAYTFLKSRLIEVGNSMIEKDYLSQAFQIVDKAAFHKREFLLPEDHVVSSEFSEKGKIKTVKKSIPDGFMGMDIGPKTIDHYTRVIKKAKTVLWNGPMGVFEMKKFSAGTFAIAKAMAKVKGTTIVGGGDSIFALSQTGLEDKMTHVSTGGGATLEYLEGKKLPGVEALLK
jgi:phosphoglycerate kinase